MEFIEAITGIPIIFIIILLAENYFYNLFFNQKSHSQLLGHGIPGKTPREREGLYYDHALDFSRRESYSESMIPQDLKPLFWDTNLDNFNPTDYPEYTISRVLEFGDRNAISWLKETFSDAQIQEVIRTEKRLSSKSAHFWALVYGIPESQVAALQ